MAEMTFFQCRKIEGDFICGTCGSKKGALTHEEFTGMPPVLNLQVVRRFT